MVLIDCCKFFIISILLLIVSLVSFADSILEPPPLPKEGEYLPFSNRTDVGLWFISKEGTTHFYRWHPATAKLIPLVSMTLCSSPTRAIENQYGVFVFCNDSGYLLNISTTNQVLSKKITHARFNPRLLSLIDGKVLLIGGLNHGKSDRTIAESTIEIAYPTKNKQLYLSKIADIPADIIRGNAVTLLANGNVMFVGGAKQEGSFYHCEGCSNKSYILDAKTKSWTTGATLLQARKNATATLLADGSLLVVGGFTPDYPEGDGSYGTQSVETLPKSQNNFVQASPLLIGQAAHYAIPLIYNTQQYVLVAGGKDEAKSIQLYDVKNAKWLYLDGFMPYCEGVSFGVANVVLPFSFDNHLWLPPKPRCTQQHTKLRMPNSKGESIKYAFDVNKGLPVDFWVGRVTVNTPEYAVFNQGFLTNLSNKRDSENNQNYTVSDYIELRHIIWKDGHIQTLQPNEALPTDIAVNQTMVNLDDLPPLRRARKDTYNKQLADGRIIVAGGEVQIEKKLALLAENATKLDAADPYIELGEFLPTRTYDIFDSNTQQWRTSALAKTSAHGVEILDDGRVVHHQDNMVEISTADGTAWQILPLPIDKFIDDEQIWLQQNELFFSGVFWLNKQRYHIIFWYDQTTQQWQQIHNILYPETDRASQLWIKQLPNGKKVVVSSWGFQ